MPILDHKTAGTTVDFFSSQVSDARRFFLGRRSGVRGAVVGAGVERVGKDYLVDRPGFEFAALEFVAGGVGELVLPTGRHVLTPGTCFTYGPGVAHRIATDARNRLVKYFIDVSAEGGRGTASADGGFGVGGLQAGVCWRTSRPAEVARLFEELLSEGRAGGKDTGPICDHLFRALLLRAEAGRDEPAGRREGSAEAGRGGGGGKGGGGGVGFETYQRCCRVIEDRAREVRSLRELAERCGTSPEYLCRLFRRYDRQSPYHRLVAARMAYAAARLRQSSAMVRTVAEELGYRDPFHFSRVFRGAFGVSPERFRSGR